MNRSDLLTRCLCLVLASGLVLPARAQERADETALARQAGREAARASAAPGQPEPFGANLFAGAYAPQRDDGLNPDYRILPGDRVMVNAWGAVTLNDVFVVDTQGNVFLPGVGPVSVAGVRNAELTEVVRRAMQRTYRGAFEVYTNLLTSSPVAVFVTGGVERPGRYAGIPSDSPLVFLHQAGGIRADTGSYRHITVLRREQEIARLDLYEFLLRGRLPALQLQDGDVILVGRRGPVVEVYPGPSAAGPVAPLLVELLAPSVTGEALLEIVAPGPRVDSVTVRGVRGAQPTARAFDLASFASIEVRGGDVVVLRHDLQPDYVVVRLEGEFLGPAEVAVQRGTRLLDLLNHVPVDLELARVDSVHLRRRSVAQQQRASIHESLDRLERTVALAESDTQGESTIRRQEAEMVRQWAQGARGASPLGVVVTASAGEQLNILLEDGDTIVVPRRTNVVRVVGEVSVANAVMYRPDLRVRDYVRMAGGYTARADEGHVIVRRASAEIVFGNMDTAIHPGDELIVPPEVDDKWIQNGIDLAGVIYQIAIATAVLMRPAL
jgi:protein involved in polysaccharide export with SLBB domain